THGQRRFMRGEVTAHVTHSNRSFEHRRITTGRDGAGTCIVDRDDSDSGSRGRAAFQTQSDAHPVRTVFKLVANRGPAWKVPSLSAPLSDRPSQACFYRRGQLVDIVA